MTLWKLWAFYKRDWQLAMSRRFSAFSFPVQAVAGLLPFFFIGKMIGRNYFQFVLLGIAFSGLMSAALSGFKQMIAFERGHGTLEAILATPTSFTGMMWGRTLWDLTAVAGQVGIYLVVGSAIFHIDLSRANWPAGAGVMLLTVGTFLGLGMILAGSFLLWRESGPLELFLGGASRFLGGVYFPVGILPGWLQSAAHCLPFTHALAAVRKSLLEGASLPDLWKELGILSVFSALLLPAGWLFFRWSLREARRRGILGLD